MLVQGGALACKDMTDNSAAVFELVPVRPPGATHSVATLHRVPASQRAPGGGAASPPADGPDEDWLEGVVIVHEQQGEVFEAAIDLAAVRKALGTASVEVLRDVRRLTLPAFVAVGATRVHRLTRDLAKDAAQRCVGPAGQLDALRCFLHTPTQHSSSPATPRARGT